MKENYQTNEKNPVAFWSIFIIIGFMAFVYSYLTGYKINQHNRDLAFAGKVKKIEYDIKQFPTITVEDSNYYIGYNTDQQIEIGDSVIKRKGADFYILIKNKTHKIIKLAN